jgi:hemolysin III
VTNESVEQHPAAAELANALTHGFGAALSVAALCMLVINASSIGGASRIVSVSVFGATMVALYGASTWYHSVRDPRWKHCLRVFDHSCIYLLIAGTYTPFMLVGLGGGWGWSLFGVVWGLALCGVVLKIFFINKLPVLSVGIYIGMGWLAIIAIKPVVAALPTAGLIWLVAGGLAYTFGVVFYAWESLRHNHAIWHLFVMTGTACHFVSIYWYVLPL